MFSRFIAKLFGTAARTPIRNDNRTRPQLEGMEAREVPAILTWKGAYGTNFNTAMNWEVFNVVTNAIETPRIPVAGDSLVYKAVPAVVIEDPDATPPGPTIPEGRDCINMHGPSDGDRYASVKVDETYNKTITLSGGFTTNEFVLESGAIKQPFAGTDITVASSFLWYGGKLNSDPYTATVWITGAGTTGTIAPKNAGVLELGSNLTFQNGATGAFFGGIVTFLNEANLKIEATATVSMASPNAAQPARLAASPNIAITKNEVQVLGGTYDFTNATSELPVVVSGGTFYIPVSPQSKVTGQKQVGAIPTSVFVRGHTAKDRVL